MATALMLPATFWTKAVNFFRAHNPDASLSLGNFQSTLQKIVHLHSAIY